jgi:hypothetical protein
MALERVTFLDFVHRLMPLKARRFGNWICFPPHVKCWGTCSPASITGVQWEKLALSKGPYTIDALNILPEGRNTFSFLNFVFLREIIRWTKSKNMILPCSTVFLFSVHCTHRLGLLKPQRFGSLFCCYLQVTGGQKSVGPLIQLVSNLVLSV